MHFMANNLVNERRIRGAVACQQRMVGMLGGYGGHGAAHQNGHTGSFMLKESFPNTPSTVKVSDKIRFQRHGINKESFTKQFVNVLELALFNKGLEKVSFDIWWDDKYNDSVITLRTYPEDIKTIQN